MTPHDPRCSFVSSFWCGFEFHVLMLFSLWHGNLLVFFFKRFFRALRKAHMFEGLTDEQKELIAADLSEMDAKLPGGGLRLGLFFVPSKNWRGPNPNGPYQVSCDRAIRYSGFFGVREKWVRPLEISWIGLSVRDDIPPGKDRWLITFDALGEIHGRLQFALPPFGEWRLRWLAIYFHDHSCDKFRQLGRW